MSKERQNGLILGPFNYPPFNYLRVSFLGVIPKKTPGEFRMIHHLSFPYGDSINTFIPPEFSTVNYATADDAINIIKFLGRGCVLAILMPGVPLEYYQYILLTHLISLVWSIVFNYCTHQSWMARSRHLIDI